MDAFQDALDALVKESKEQITRVQEAAAAAVLHAHVVPHRIAVAIGQRFTAERVDTAYPVLCLLDATLVRINQSTTNTAKATTSNTAAPSTLSSSSPVPTSSADQALLAVLKEFWQVAEAVFVSLHDYGAAQPSWREKCLRMVRRWKQRKLLNADIVDGLVTTIEKGPAVATVVDAAQEEEDVTIDEGDSNRKGHVSREGHDVAGSGSAGRAGALVSSRAARSAATTFTAAQSQHFCATLQACLSALESLPAARKSLYFGVIHAQHLRTPTKSSLLFYEELLSELRHEVTASSSASALSTAQGASADATSATTAASGAEKTGSRPGAATGDTAAAQHAREALGKLLEQLNSGGADDAHGGRGGHWPGSGTGASHMAATTVVRYVSPIFSDLYAKQPLGQRGTGFGILQRKAEHGSANNAFYTSYYPKPVASAQRPFRIPATRQMSGGAVRLWFPSPQEWVRTADMADLAQFASRNAADKDRKRAREGE